MKTQTSIRGLEARCRLARAAIARIVGHVTDAEELECLAGLDAESLGFHDGQAGADECPILFEDTDLASAWRYGHGLYQASFLNIEADRIDPASV
jgi:hypothetical protein